ncbi:MAG: aldo/keto reductase [Gammaproteobacteria bacterium]|nr:aldo/keto reductase [Gammaproteobacteria bacterium]
MTNRREFLAWSGAAAALAGSPVLAMGGKPAQLPTRTIPGRDERLPIIGLGNSRAFSDADTATTRSLLEIFFGHGGAYIDIGGSARSFVGGVARKLGAADQVFFGNYVDPVSQEVLEADVREVAKAQGKVALDLVHMRNLGRYRETIELFRRLKGEGLVRYIGIARSGSDGFPAIGRLIEDGLVDFVQVNYSLLEPESADRLLPLAKDHGVAVNINRPFINGRYFERVSRHELPEWAIEFDCHSWAQFSLKFILANAAVTCVLTETSNPKHALDNIGGGFGALPDMRTQLRMLAYIRELG